MDWTWAAWDDLDRDALHDVARVRQRVFVVEQACPYLDLDGLDPRAMHLVGRIDGAIAAYLRAFAPGALRDEAVIGRVLTAPEHRGRGLGRALMVEGHRRVARAWGRVPIALGAQAHLRDFYASLGYRCVGPAYDEDGISHLPMRRPRG